MQRMVATPFAVLLGLDTIRMALLVLFGRVVTTLAVRAGQSDQRTHEYSSIRSLSLAVIHMNSEDAGLAYASPAW